MQAGKGQSVERLTPQPIDRSGIVGEARERARAHRRVRRGAGIKRLLSAPLAPMHSPESLQLAARVGRRGASWAASSSKLQYATRFFPACSAFQGPWVQISINCLTFDVLFDV